MENKPNHHSIVAKDNSMVEHLAGFKLSELRLIAYCLAHYDPSKGDNRTFYAKVSDLAELFPINEKSAYAVVERAMLGINEKPLRFKDGRKKHFWNWFSGFVYEEGTGEFEFRITPEIQPYLLGLSETFTKYRLGAVYQFKSAHTWKLYENLKKEAFKNGPWAPSVDELKILLGVPGKYKRVSEFDRCIIAPATNEINEKSDLKVEYDKRKRGRSIVGIVFQITEKPEPGAIDVETPKQSFFRLLLLEGIKEKTILEYFKMAENRGKVSRCIDQIPRIINRWNKNKGPKQKYLLGSLKKEINQQTLFPDPTPPKASGHIDFSFYNNKDLMGLLNLPAYKDAVKAELTRRGIQIPEGKK